CWFNESNFLKYFVQKTDTPGIKIFSGGILFIFLIPVAFFIAMNIIFIPYEEKAMEETFGREYLNYKNRVRRWF
ncbi:hypothetical protein KAU39_01815, partial [bacterium]|nr:hypothetical protein [bacterium]